MIPCNVVLSTANFNSGLFDKPTGKLSDFFSNPIIFVVNILLRIPPYDQKRKVSEVYSQEKMEKMANHKEISFKKLQQCITK